MSLENYQILIKKYRFADTTEVKDINIFSTATKTLESVFDLTPYVCGDENIKIASNFVKVDKAKIYSQMRMSSAIDLKLDDIDEDLRIFFEIYNDTTYLKYLCEIYKLDTNERIFLGIVHQDSISEQLLDTQNYEDLEIIELTISEYDKEFKDYFSQKKLKRCAGEIQMDDEITWQYDYNIKPLWDRSHFKYIAPFGWTWVREKYFEYNKFNTLKSILLQNFETISDYDIEMDADISAYNVSRDSFLFKKLQVNKNYLFIKCGYQRISENNETVWGFLNKLCNSMGWDFYFSNGKLNIRNRVKTPVSSETISMDLFTKYTILKDKAEDSFQNIYIHNGQIQHGWSGQGGYYREMTGNRSINILDNQKILNSNHFDSMNNLDPLVMHRLQASNGLKFEQVWLANDVEFQIRIFKQNGSGGYLNWDYSEIYRMNKSDTLEIDGGDTGSNAMLYNMDEFYNMYYDIASAPPKQPYEFNFSGNYGNCLYKKISDTNYFTYDDYIKSNLFLNNFLFLKKNIAGVLRIKGEIDELKLSFADRISISDDENLEGEYVAEKFITDIEDEVTEVELIKLLEND